jgi:uncharacterized protein (DUF1810 family)
VLAPACDRIKLPRVSWHSFQHPHATLLTEEAESIKTAQALLDHSELGRTLNPCSHGIHGSQYRAAQRVAGDLFSKVLEAAEDAHGGKTN